MSFMGYPFIIRLLAHLIRSKLDQKFQTSFSQHSEFFNVVRITTERALIYINRPIPLIFSGTFF